MTNWAAVGSLRLTVLNGAREGESIEGEPVVSVWTTNHTVTAE